MANHTQKPEKRKAELSGDTLLRHVQDTMAGGLFTVDPKGRITSWNRGMEQITGYGADEALGRTCQMLNGDTCFKGPTAHPSERCALFAGEEVRNKRCCIRHKDGTQVQTLKQACLMHDEAGKVLGAIEVLTDLSSIVALQDEVSRLRRVALGRDPTPRLVGEHPSMLRLFDMIATAGATHFPVLVQGETGTGKELVAKAVHAASPRRDGPYVCVSCAALPESLLEGELFGHVRGAFTGANNGRKGRFEEASGGTLVLDEIGDISPVVQTKLLRVLQQQTIERVGANQAVPVDIRVVAVTNRNLLEMCQRGEFRSDLYYRLAVIPVEVTPLRDRASDIPRLVEYFVDRLSAVLGRPVPVTTPEAMRALVAHRWPGNVRELEHALEYAFAVSSDQTIDVAHLPPNVTNPAPQPTSDQPNPRRGLSAPQITAALARHDGVKARAARDLGVSRVTLWKWMKKLGLQD